MMEINNPKLHFKNNTKVNSEYLKTCVHANLWALREKTKIGSINCDEYFGIESQKKLEQVYEIVKQNLADRGISDVSFSELIFKKEKSSEDSLVHGQHMLGLVTIYNNNIENKQIKQLQVFKNTAHELYHDVGMGSVHANYFEGDISMAQHFAGASISNMSAHGGLLEEGCAVQFANQVFEQLKSLFDPEIISLYEKFTTIAVEELNNINSARKGLGNRLLDYFRKDKTEEEMAKLESILEEMQESLVVSNDILITGVTPKGEFEYGYNQYYTASRRCVEFLSKEIPDFFKLLEQARINGKLLPLARAVDGRFGAGWYRKIVSVGADQANQILKELKSIPQKTQM